MIEPLCRKGHIVSVSPTNVVVHLSRSTACESCAASGKCGGASANKTTVDVPISPNKQYKVGQEVAIVVKQFPALWAVWWSYGCPLVLLLFTLVGVASFTGRELLAASSALLVLVPYYLLLWLFRKRMAHKVKYEITG